MLENGTVLDADVVVANADLTYVYDKLLGHRDEDKAYAKDLDGRVYCSGVITFYWSLSKVCLLSGIR
jgi:hypothetical protein